MKYYTRMQAWSEIKGKKKWLWQEPYAAYYSNLKNGIKGKNFH